MLELRTVALTRWTLQGEERLYKSSGQRGGWYNKLEEVKKIEIGVARLDCARAKAREGRLKKEVRTWMYGRGKEVGLYPLVMCWAHIRAPWIATDSWMMDFGPPRKLALFALPVCAPMRWVWISFPTSQGAFCEAEEDGINRETQRWCLVSYSLPWGRWRKIQARTGMSFHFHKQMEGTQLGQDSCCASFYDNTDSPGWLHPCPWAQGILSGRGGNSRLRPSLGQTLGGKLSIFHMK